MQLAACRLRMATRAAPVRLRLTVEVDLARRLGVIHRPAWLKAGQHNREHQRRATDRANERKALFISTRAASPQMTEQRSRAGNAKKQRQRRAGRTDHARKLAIPCARGKLPHRYADHADRYQECGDQPIPLYCGSHFQTSCMTRVKSLNAARKCAARLCASRRQNGRNATFRRFRLIPSLTVIRAALASSSWTKGHRGGQAKRMRDAQLRCANDRQ